VPLRRDFANIDEVVQLLREPARAQEIVERAWREVAANPAYGYAAFVRQIDDAILARLDARAAA
jgi:hypothetical protein